jgi:hypothetical protein
MIHNPYPIPTDELDRATTRFQTYLSGEDKGLLFGVRPIRGTPQAVINHLIKNLCDDLRDHNITQYHPDADTIFSILVERRPLSADQLSRIRRAIAGTDKQVSERVQHDSRGTSVRKGSTGTKTGPNHPAIKTLRGEQPNRKTQSKTKSKTKTISR